MSSSTSVVATTGAARSTSQRARYRRLLQLRWWLLPKLLAAPPRGAAIDILFNFSGGCCRSYRHHPQGLAIDISLNLVLVAIIFLATPTKGSLR
jgi:hypothetical protein